MGLDELFNTIYAEGVVAIEGDLFLFGEVGIADGAFLCDGVGFGFGFGFETDDDGDIGDIHIDAVFDDELFEEAIELEWGDGGAVSADDGVDFAG